MGEVVNVVVAFAVIIFIVRWATTSSTSPSLCCTHFVIQSEHEVVNPLRSKLPPVLYGSGRRK